MCVREAARWKSTTAAPRHTVRDGVVLGSRAQHQVERNGRETTLAVADSSPAIGVHLRRDLMRVYTRCLLRATSTRQCAPRRVEL